MTNQTCILSTKTLSADHRQAFIDANIDLLEQDFIEIENIDFDLNNINENLIFTSQNAVFSLVEKHNFDSLKTKKVFCVGIKTKQLLEQNGFEVAVYMDYASELAEIIKLIYNQESYTFFSGNLRKDTLPLALKNAKIKFNEIEVYQTKLSPCKISDLEKFDGIMFFSPSAVESYLKDNKIKIETCFCIGETTSEYLESKKIKNIVIAENPSVDDVVAEVLEYYNR